MPERYRWWQRGIIYQIYPRSFQDGNGDGIGDLNGITARLDYLRRARRRRDLDLADLSFADGGFRLRRGRLHATSIRCSARWRISTRWSRRRMRAGCKIILDFVPNHTSDRHPWFIESRVLARQTQSATGTSGATRRPTAVRRTTGSASSAAAPGHWMRRPGNTTTTPFSKEQPDLNWRNPRGSAAMLECCASGSTAAWTASASMRSIT